MISKFDSLSFATVSVFSWDPYLLLKSYLELTIKIESGRVYEWRQS